MAIKTAVDRGR